MLVRIQVHLVWGQFHHPLCKIWQNTLTVTELCAFVCVSVCVEVTLDAPSILSTSQCQTEEKHTKELGSQRKWTKFNFSPGCSSCLPHKAKTYYEMGTNIIIIQTWWGALCLMEAFNLVHLTTMLALWSWFASVFWSPAIWIESGCRNWEFSDLVGMCADGGYWFI